MIDVSVEKFLAKAQEVNADIVGVSALLTTTMVGMKRVIDAIHAAESPANGKVIIGGAPVTQQYANDIGADGYAADAASAVALAKRLMGIEVALSADEAARALLLEVRDLYETAIRRDKVEDIREGVLEAKDLAQEAREKGADLIELQRILDAIERELSVEA